MQKEVRLGLLNTNDYYDFGKHYANPPPYNFEDVHVWYKADEILKPGDRVKISTGEYVEKCALTHPDYLGIVTAVPNKDIHEDFVIGETVRIWILK